MSAMETSPHPARARVAEIAGRVLDNWAFRILALASVGVGAFLLLYGVPGLEEFWMAKRGANVYRTDLDVYRLGGQVLLQGGDLYGRLPDIELGANLPFTYPPIAAILFAPLALMPLKVASALFTVVSIVAFAVAVWVVSKEVSGLTGSRAAWFAVALTGATMWIGPMRETIWFGQINNVLMALVVIDLIALRGRKWQGCLVGLALAIKLTPAVFLAYFLVRKQWRAMLVGIVSALVYTAIGFAVTWRDSVTYWTETIVSTDRIGNLAYLANQSINGLVRRLILDDTTASIVWFASCAVLGLSLLWLMWRLSAMGLEAAAIVTMGLYSLLASPVSWSHHWVWCVPAILVLAFLWRTEPAPVAWVGGAVAALGVWVFYSRIIWEQPIVDDGVVQWTPWQQVLGNAQTLWALLALATLFLAACWPRRRPDPEVAAG